MRIFHIMAGRGNGGAETYAADVILALHEAGIAQRVVWHLDQARYEELARAGIALAPQALRFPLRFLQRRAVADLMRGWQPDLTHCWMRRAAGLIAKTATPAIGWFGGYYNVAHFKACDYFVGVTPEIAAHQRAHGAAEDRSFFIPTFPTLDDSPPQDRALLDTPADARVLLALSRLHPKKGLDVLLRALVELPDCTLWLAGDGELRAELQALAARLGVAARVRFLGWRTDRGALLRAADACVLPSRYEPFGTVMLEAWAAGVPLVAAAAAGPAAFLRDGENGLLVPVDDAGALTAALRRLLDSPDLRARICAGGKAAYEAQFTRAAVTRQWIGLYERIMKDRS